MPAREVVVLLVLLSWLAVLARAESGLGTEELVAELRRVSEASGRPLLVGAVGFDARAMLRDVERAAPDLGMEVSRISALSAEQEEMQRLLRRSPGSCAVYVSVVGQSWRTRLHGDCGDLPTVAPAVVPEAEKPAGGAASGPPAHPPAQAPEASGTDSPDAAEPGAPAPRAAAPPPAAFDPREAWPLLRAHHAAPDPTAAVLTSALVGFGTGHFYAGNFDSGIRHAFLQGGGVALMVLGALAASNSLDERPGVAVQLIGLNLVAWSRLVELATAAPVARREAIRTIEEASR